MTSSARTPATYKTSREAARPASLKRFSLPELLALLLAVLCAVWAIREHVWPVSILILALAVTMVVRNRRAMLAVPAKYSGLAMTIAAVLFAGPFLILLAAIFRPQVVLPTVLAVTCVHAVIALFGAQDRLLRRHRERRAGAEARDRA
jgi:hypothetical protein